MIFIISNYRSIIMTMTHRRDGLVVLIVFLWCISFSDCYAVLPCRQYQHSSSSSSSSWAKVLAVSEVSATECKAESSRAPSPLIDEVKEMLIPLLGTPELVDKLENLVSKHPGIELDIDLYRALYPYKLDDFQERGIEELIAGNNVIVTTPTGSGKTLVGELAIYFSMMMGLRVAYTTPLKALSNQKFADFKARYGGDRVGLLTGDIAINRGAPITVMTTEVFRNMVYDPDSAKQLSDVFVVIFDEFHYMNDPDRGTVWEECVISCPSHIRMLALSATMGNVEDIKGWFEAVHGPTQLVVSTHRPVPLRYLFALKSGLMPLFRDPNSGPGAPNGVRKAEGKLHESSVINPSITKMEEQALKKSMTRATTSQPFRRPKPNPSALVPRFVDVTEDLHNLKLLPAIIFIFSRAGCEQAAKMITQSRTRLVSDEDARFVQQAINLFARNNPEIPIHRSTVNMLKAGVAVHHAGLIPVWKAFVEDLFNANKIKVLFATETLAAGVNMPARTTVITSVTKKVNSEVVKLKTSQLLQMAGRAGRRGKDVEGTVVLMRSKFEDAKVGHKILTSNIDGIRSNFKISYGLAVKLLETKTLKECRDLLERGFGSYLLQMRNLNKNSDNELVSLDDYRLTLRKYTLQGARDYLKLKRRLEKEVRSMEFQLEKMTESDEDLVLAIADYMPLGIGLQLKSGDLGFFLGDVRWGNNNANSGFGIILTDGDTLQIVNKEHIKAFAETEESIPIGVAQDLLDLVGKVPLWEETKISGLKRPALTGRFDKRSLAEESKLSQAVDVVKASRLQVSMKEPGSLTKQRMIIEELEAELTLSPIERAGAGDAVLQALRHAVAQKDPIAFVNSAVKETQSPVTFAWRMFNSVMALLQEFEALNGTVATDLGQTVGSLTGDNELWLALVLQRPSVIALNATELAAVLCGVITDGFKATNAYFRQRPSERVRDTFDELEQLSFELKAAQSEAGVEFPVNLCRETGGMIEQWASGVSWRELCKDTSLDQGDVCRILRRTVEILRQIPLAYGISPAVGQKAYEAANLMDRFPVADFDPNVDSKERTGVGFGGTGEGAEDISDEGIQFEEDSDFEDDARQEARNKETSSLLDALEVLDYDVDDIISGLELNNLN